MRSAPLLAVLGYFCMAACPSGAQKASGASSIEPPVTITVRSDLVFVPALVKTKAGELVFSLAANDFVLTDDGIARPLSLEQETDAQPSALTIVVQTGGKGAAHLKDYRNLQTELEAIAGGAPHLVEVIGFDSAPQLRQAFTPDTDAAASAIASLEAGDGGAAILDALKFGIAQLQTAPPEYRRVLLLLSETIDSGSQTPFEQALRAVDDTNTSIYSFALSSTRSVLGHEASKIPIPNITTAYSNEPYPPGGCFSQGADPDARGKRSVQALDCASDLLPPLRFARLAWIAARDGFHRNVPEAVAELTGGDYVSFKDEKGLKKALLAVAHDVPNRYVLSFRPEMPAVGLHALSLKLKDADTFEVKARRAYWVDAAAAK